MNQKARKGNAPAISILFILLVLPLLPIIPMSNAQTDPPPFGEGDWTIMDDTIIKDRTLRIRGSVDIMSGGSLTLDNTTLLLQLSTEYEYHFNVTNNARLNIVNGSFVGAFDQPYAIYSKPGSILRVRNSTIDGIKALVIGSSDAIIEDTTIEAVDQGIVNWGGVTIIRRSDIRSIDKGVWNVYGDLKIHDSTILRNRIGIDIYHVCGPSIIGEMAKWAPDWTDPNRDRCNGPRTATITNNLISDSIYTGIQVSYSSVIARSNIIKDAMVNGIEADNSYLELEDNEISGNPYGLLVEDWYETAIPQIPMIIYLTNNNITNCSQYAMYSSDSETIQGAWTVNKEVMVDSPIWTRIPLTIESGGRMTLKDTSLNFMPNASTSQGATILAGGTLDLLSMTMRPGGVLGTDVYLRNLADGTLNISDSTIEDIGFEYGSSGESAGIYSQGTLDIASSVVEGGVYDIVNDGGRTTIHDSLIKDGSFGLYIQGGGSIDAYNSTLENISVADIQITTGEANFYNISFDKGSYITQVGTSQFDVYWYAQLESQWQNGAPLGNVSYDIYEDQGTWVLDRSGSTDPKGTTDTFVLREFFDDGGGATMVTPHLIEGSYGPLVSNTTASVHENTDLVLQFVDDIDPFINISSPGFVDHRTDPNITVTGNAMDNESGLDRVQWSFDEDLWYDANGSTDWSFTTKLPFGTTPIFVRATDIASNTATRRILVTVDKDAPLLIITSPWNGTVTDLRTVLVSGRTEMGATVTINGLSTVSQDGSFRLSVPLEEGENLINVTAMDGTGNTNRSSVTVIRDTTPPELIIYKPLPDYYTNRVDEVNLAVLGHTEPGVDLKVDGKNMAIDKDGNFSFTTGLVEGLNVINFLVEDDAGNTNATVRRIYYDLTIPQMALYSPEDGTVLNQTTVLVEGVSEPGIFVKVENGDDIYDLNTTDEGVFSLEVTLTEGKNTILVKVLDRSGNKVQGLRRVYLDTLPPSIKLLNVYDGKFIDGTTFLIEGETEIGSSVHVNLEKVQVGRSGKFSMVLSLPSLNNTLTVEVVDEAGNRNSTTIHLLRRPDTQREPNIKDMGADLFPWVLSIVIIGIVMQWLWITRWSLQRKAKRLVDEKFKDEDEVDGPDQDDSISRRTRQEGPFPVDGATHQQEGDADGDDEGVEFEIEDGGSDQ